MSLHLHHGKSSDAKTVREGDILCKKIVIQETAALTDLFEFSGLRLFKEAKDWDSRGMVTFICTFHCICESYNFKFLKLTSFAENPLQHWDDHPAVMAVGVIDGTSENIFNTLMSLGPTRSE